MIDLGELRRVGIMQVMRRMNIILVCCVALFVPQSAKAFDFRATMEGCLVAVNQGSIDGFADQNFTTLENGALVSDNALTQGVVRVLFVELEQPSYTGCMIFGHGKTANDVILRWDDVETTAASWHQALVALPVWEDITTSQGLGFAAMNCGSRERPLIASIQPVWQAIIPLKPKHEADEILAADDAAVKFEIGSSDRINCDKIRAQRSKEAIQ